MVEIREYFNNHTIRFRMLQGETQKGRIVWIDNVKLFAILCVIIYHSSALVINEYYYAGWIIETFNMALFFFLSGLTSRKRSLLELCFPVCLSAFLYFRSLAHSGSC